MELYEKAGLVYQDNNKAYIATLFFHCELLIWCSFILNRIGYTGMCEVLVIGSKEVQME